MSDVRFSLPTTRTSVTIKLIVVGILIVALMIPAVMVMQLISEREQRRNQAVNEISESWSGPQTLAGPLLALPVRLQEKDKDGKPFHRTVLTYHLPDALSVDGKVDTQTRYRGIYKTAVYTAVVLGCRV